MDFAWQPEQRRTYDRMVAFARDDLNADVSLHDRDGIFPRDKWQRCADQGVLALAVRRNIPPSSGVPTPTSCPRPWLWKGWATGAGTTVSSSR